MTTLAQQKLEQDFHYQMIGVHRSAKNECNYNATCFIQLVTKEGGLRAAKRLLASPRHSDGLTELYLYGRLDISMEYLILQQPWRALVSNDELATARRRLVELHFDVP